MEESRSEHATLPQRSYPFEIKPSKQPCLNAGVPFALPRRKRARSIALSMIPRSSHHGIEGINDNEHTSIGRGGYWHLRRYRNRHASNRTSRNLWSAKLKILIRGSKLVETRAIRNANNSHRSPCRYCTVRSVSILMTRSIGCVH